MLATQKSGLIRSPRNWPHLPPLLELAFCLVSRTYVKKNTPRHCHGFKWDTILAELCKICQILASLQPPAFECHLAREKVAACRCLSPSSWFAQLEVPDDHVQKGSPRLDEFSCCDHPGTAAPCCRSFVVRGCGSHKTAKVCKLYASYKQCHVSSLLSRGCCCCCRWLLCECCKKWCRRASGR